MDPIPSSYSDMERRRLEATLDHSLHSVSLDSLPTASQASAASSSSFSTTISLEYPRAAPALRLSTMYPPNGLAGPHGTPRAAAYRKPSGMSAGSAASVGESPVSTAGHHVSQMTLAEGVFRRAGAGREDDSGSEFDPERSLGRLVQELGKVMGNEKLPPRPSSPFAGALSPPRSPSPLPSMMAGANKDFNLSFTLNRNDPLLSPPTSRQSSAGSGSNSQDETPRPAPKSSTGFSSLARELGAELADRRAPARKALGEITRDNVGATPGPTRKGKEDRIKALQGENRRPHSAPARSHPLDVTGMTGLMETPAKGDEFGSIRRNAQLNPNAGVVPDALATLQARLRALDMENSVSRRRVRELESELDRAKADVENAKRGGGRRLKEVIGEKSALEDLVKSLRAHLARITLDLEEHKAMVISLQSSKGRAASPPRHGDSVSSELAALRREVERLSNEVRRLGGIIEDGLDARRKARDVTSKAPTVDLLGPEPAEEDPRLPSALRQGLHTAGHVSPTLVPPTVEPATRLQPRSSAPREPIQPAKIPLPPSSESSSSDADSTRTAHRFQARRKSTRPRVDGPGSPFPSIRAEDEPDFFERNLRAEAKSKSAPTRRPLSMPALATSKSRRVVQSLGVGIGGTDELPPQTVLARVLRELEDDFAHYKAIYAELADQYKVLDPASAAAKRHVLADHLREVIDILEQKADQIAALYDLLHFEDKPLSQSAKARGATKSVHDVMRMVKESLGEEAFRRLMEDGVGGGRKLHRAV